MISVQELYDKASNSLRNYGNPYGTFLERKWTWVNPHNFNDRCAIARFIDGIDSFEVKRNLSKLCNYSEIHNALILDITCLFDNYPLICNNQKKLENKLKQLADKHKLKYKSNKETRFQILEELTKEAQEFEMGY
jgi:hypothetical protein